jgi:hypothetical protein
MNFDQIVRVTSGVLNLPPMLLHGMSQDPKEPNLKKAVAWYMPDETFIKEAIAQDLVLQGSSVINFLNTWKLECCLRSRWGLGVDSTTIRTLTQGLEKVYSSIADQCG